MKKILQKPIVRKALAVIIAFFIFIIVMNYIVMPWYVSSPELNVPKVLGLTESDAVNILKDKGLTPIVSDTTYDENFPRGTILYQRPNAGETVKEGRRIYLFISGGEPVVQVPVLKGKSLIDARFALERIGLFLGRIDSITSNYPKNVIFDQQFAVGTPLKKGDSVGVSFSIGPTIGSITVPNLIGKSLVEAEQILADSTLRVGKINFQPSISLLPNTILDQYPSQGDKIDSGSSVDLFVTKPAETNNQNSNMGN